MTLSMIPRSSFHAVTKRGSANNPHPKERPPCGRFSQGGRVHLQRHGPSAGREQLERRLFSVLGEVIELTIEVLFSYTLSRLAVRYDERKAPKREPFIFFGILLQIFLEF